MTLSLVPVGRCVVTVSSNLNQLPEHTCVLWELGEGEVKGQWRGIRNSKMVERRDKFHLTCDRGSGKVGTTTRMTFYGSWFSVPESPWHRKMTRCIPWRDFCSWAAPYIYFVHGFFALFLCPMENHVFGGGPTGLAKSSILKKSLKCGGGPRWYKPMDSPRFFRVTSLLLNDVTDILDRLYMVILGQTSCDM